MTKLTPNRQFVCHIAPLAPPALPYRGPFTAVISAVVFGILMTAGDVGSCRAAAIAPLQVIGVRATEPPPARPEIRWLQPRRESSRPEPNLSADPQVLGVAAFSSWGMLARETRSPWQPTQWQPTSSDTMSSETESLRGGLVTGLSSLADWKIADELYPGVRWDLCPKTSHHLTPIGELAATEIDQFEQMCETADKVLFAVETDTAVTRQTGIASRSAEAVVGNAIDRIRLPAYPTPRFEISEDRDITLREAHTTNGSPDYLMAPLQALIRPRVSGLNPNPSLANETGEFSNEADELAAEAANVSSNHDEIDTQSRLATVTRAVAPKSPTTVGDPRVVVRGPESAPVERQEPSERIDAVIDSAPSESAEPAPAGDPSEPDPGAILALDPAAAEMPELVISPSMQSLKPRLNELLQFYYQRPMNTQDDSSWSVMHSLLGYGVNTPLAVGGARGRRVNALQWMCYNNPCMNRRLFYLDRSSRIIGREGPGYQGHPGQFLAMLAQIGVPADFPMQIQQRRFTVLDLVNREQQSVRADQELTFRLIALAHYLPTDASWVNELGETWDLAKILGVELASPINGAPCGGTHRIMACSVAVLERAADGLPIDGNFARAQKYVEDYQKYAFSLQNRDGSFSSDWFKRPARWGDKDRQLQTTGHILEWLVYSLPRHRLSDPQVVRAVHFLSELMVAHRFHEWEVGPRGHALRALSLYRQRVFPSPDAQPLAGQSKQQR